MTDAAQEQFTPDCSATPINRLIPSQLELSEVCTIVISSLRPAHSPRLDGEDEEHIHRLAETDTALPPIIVHRPTMRVIDGMHRLRAAMLKGHSEIEARFFDGSEDEAFIQGVKENVTHGLPLAIADRKSAAARIICSQPQLSDRAIAAYTGLSARTVAAIRQGSSADVPQSNTRIGADGRPRPLSASEGRRRASEIIEARPGASLREIAKEAKVSLGTAHDVRRRMLNGMNPIPRGPAGAGGKDVPSPGLAPPPAERAKSRSAMLENLTKDPSLRHTDQGRELLRRLHTGVIEAEDWSKLVAAVPAHCTESVAELARYCADFWDRFAQDLDRRG